MATPDPWEGVLPEYTRAWVPCTAPGCTTVFARMIREDSAPDVLAYVGSLAEREGWQVDWTDHPPAEGLDRCPAHLHPTPLPTLAQVRQERRKAGAEL